MSDRARDEATSDAEIVREALVIANDANGCWYDLPIQALDRLVARLSADRDTPPEDSGQATSKDFGDGGFPADVGTAAIPSVRVLSPAAYRCWERVLAVLPPSVPTKPDDPSVALDTIMAMLHAALCAAAEVSGGECEHPQECCPGHRPDGSEYCHAKDCALYVPRAEVSGGTPPLSGPGPLRRRP